ncbi:ATP-binding cassette domain-containing protein [Streptosporangium sp. NPDC001682]
MEDAYLALSKLTKTYPNQSRSAVHNVDIDVARGEFISLLGPSGCGKTTTLRMIAGLITPTSGHIRVDGTDITNRPVHKRDMGLVFQSYALFPHMSVGENVDFGLQMRRVAKSDRRRRVAEALDMVHLTHLANRRVSQLSGGQAQRIALARALVIEPTVLLLDEPLSNLDAKLREELRVQVHVWTVNNTGVMERLLDAGVDGLMTDNISGLRDVLEARGQWHPGRLAA